MRHDDRYRRRCSAGEDRSMRDVRRAVSVRLLRDRLPGMYRLLRYATRAGRIAALPRAHRRLRLTGASSMRPPWYTSIPAQPRAETRTAYGHTSIGTRLAHIASTRPSASTRAECPLFASRSVHRSTDRTYRATRAPRVIGAIRPDHDRRHERSAVKPHENHPKTL